MDRFSIAIEKLAHVGDAAASQFEGFDSSIEPPLPFVEGAKGELHSLLDNYRVRGNHGGILPKEKRSPFKAPKLPLKPNAQKANCGI